MTCPGIIFFTVPRLPVSKFSSQENHYTALTNTNTTASFANNFSNTRQVRVYIANYPCELSGRKWLVKISEHNHMRTETDYYFFVLSTNILDLDEIIYTDWITYWKFVLHIITLLRIPPSFLTISSASVLLLSSSSLCDFTRSLFFRHSWRIWLKKYQSSSLSCQAQQEGSVGEEKEQEKTLVTVICYNTTTTWDIE